MFEQKDGVVQAGERSAGSTAAQVAWRASQARSDDQKADVREKLIADLDLHYLSDTDAAKVRTMLRRQREVISDGVTTGRTNVLKHRIEVVDSADPISVPRYRRAPAQEDIEEAEVLKMKKADVIEDSKSPWAAPVVLVKKKDGTIRFCVDYRRLNAVTKKIAYPMPRVDELIEAMAGCHWFTGLDQKSGFWQIELDEDAKLKSAFRTRTGLYQYKVMPYGLVNAPASFQRLMDVVLMGMTPEFALVYIDDIIIFSRGDLDDHLAKVERVLNALRTAGLQLGLPKCQFAMSEISYLGHIVSKDGVRVDKRKVDAILKMEAPHDTSTLKSFLGAIGYHRRFIPRFGELAAPLTPLLKKNCRWKWGPEQENSFQALRRRLAEAPILVYPDWTKPFVVETDACRLCAAAATISQADGEGRLHPIAYWSRSLDQTERNYGQTECEALAAVEGVEAFSAYVWGKPFELVTDARALLWLRTTMHKNSRLVKWALALDEYNYTVRHRPGAENYMNDALSRLTKEIKDLTVEEVEWRASRPGTTTLRTRVPDRYILPARKKEVPPVPELPSETETWVLAQAQDPFANRVIEYLHDGRCGGTPEEQQDVARNAGRYEVLGDLLCYIGDAVRPQRGAGSCHNKPCLYVPQAMREEVLKRCHATTHAGHWKLYHTLRQRYYWKGMFDDTKAFVQSCDTCQRFAIPRNTGAQGGIVSKFPGDYVAIDMFGKVKEPTKRGNVFGLVIVDLYTKKVVAVGLPDKKPATWVRALEENWIVHESYPRRLLSDRDPSFLAAFAQETYRVWGTKKVTTTAWNPKREWRG